MSNMIRHSSEGDICFITIVTNHRTPIFANERNVKILFQTLREVQCIKKCDIFSFVILPDHLHLILRSFEHSTSEIIHSFKRNFTLNWKNQNIQSITFHPNKLWQKTFWEHIIYQDRDFINHLTYIYHNPVKHGYVESPDDWPYSSFIENQLYDEIGLHISENDF